MTDTTTQDTQDTEAAEAVQAEAANAERESADQRRVAEELERMREAVAKLEAKNRELAEEKANAKREAEKRSMEAIKKSGDIEALEKSWADKLAARERELMAEVEQRQRLIHNVTVGATAQRLASELALPGSADVLLPHIKARLEVEIREGQPAVRVLSRDGKVSAMSLDELKREFEANPAFAPVIVGTKASGAGQVQGAKGSGAPSGKKFNEYRSEELAALRKADPQEYQRLRDEFYGRRRT